MILGEVPEQPSGAVTLVHDVEGSTRLLAELGPERYREALGHHHTTLRDAFAGHDGCEVDNEGDAPRRWRSRSSRGILRQ
jgi:class 3 adenylate cyclase